MYSIEGGGVAEPFEAQNRKGTFRAVSMMVDCGGVGGVTMNELNWLLIYSLIVKLAKIYHICYNLTTGQYVAASKVVRIEVSALEWQPGRTDGQSMSPDGLGGEALEAGVGHQVELAGVSRQDACRGAS